MSVCVCVDVSVAGANEHCAAARNHDRRVGTAYSPLQQKQSLVELSESLFGPNEMEKTQRGTTQKAQSAFKGDMEPRFSPFHARVHHYDTRPMAYNIGPRHQTIIFYVLHSASNGQLPIFSLHQKRERSSCVCSLVMVYGVPGYLLFPPHPLPHFSV